MNTSEVVEQSRNTRTEVQQAIRALIQQYDVDLVSSVLEEVAPETETEANQLERRVWNTLDDFGVVSVLDEIISYLQNVRHKGSDEYQQDVETTIDVLEGILCEIAL